MLHRLLNALILLPDRYCYQVPADLGLRADEVTFPNAQGQLLHGFWFKPGGQTTAVEIPQDEALSSYFVLARPAISLRTSTILNSCAGPAVRC